MDKFEIHFNVDVGTQIFQVKAITDTLTEDAPATLDDYRPEVHASKFYSLPLYIATKARVDHNEALKRLAQPKINQILEDAVL